MDSLREIIERCKTRAESPEYQARAKQLSDEWDTLSKHSRELETRIRRERNGIPSEHVARFESPLDRESLRRARIFLDAPPEFRFAVLAGSAGLGKSFALAWTADQGHGRYVTAQQLVMASTFDDSLWSSLRETPVLALDELGSEHGNDAYMANLYDVLQHRHAQFKKTIIATNLSGSEFRGRYMSLGLERLLDRLRASGEWIPLSGESIRKHWSETN